MAPPPGRYFCTEVVCKCSVNSFEDSDLSGMEVSVINAYFVSKVVFSVSFLSYSGFL